MDLLPKALSSSSGILCAVDVMTGDGDDCSGGFYGFDAVDIDTTSDRERDCRLFADVEQFVDAVAWLSLLILSGM